MGTLMNSFDEASAPLKAEYGILTYAWFQVQIVAYGDSFVEQVRFEYVPSLTAYAGLVSEETYTEIWNNRQDAVNAEASSSVLIGSSSTTNMLSSNLYL